VKFAAGLRLRGHRRMKAVTIIPLVYLFAAIVLMVIAHLLLPVARLLPYPWRILGLIPLALGLALNLKADRSFKQHATTVKPTEPSAALVTDGVFGISRHPMYLGFVLLLAGLAILLGTLMPLVIVLAFAVFMDVVFIRFEEQKMADSFTAEWSAYTRRVRRWL
jgi:protein-S-isoprenylcysteine O-methyltransferase Ste14